MTMHMALPRRQAEWQVTVTDQSPSMDTAGQATWGLHAHAGTGLSMHRAKSVDTYVLFGSARCCFTASTETVQRDGHLDSFGTQLQNSDLMFKDKMRLYFIVLY